MDIPGPRQESNDLVGVRLATAADLGWLTDLLCTSFHDDPLTRWILPDPRARRAALPGFFTVFVELSLAHGGIIVGDERESALLYLSPAGVERAQERDDEIQRRLADAVGGADAGSLLLTILGMQAAHHPSHREHYYVTFGAVHPEHQGGGAISAAMAPLLAAADREGQAIYAEASSDSGAAACLSFGFTAMGSVIRLPGGPTLRPMWREPR
ncbi:GNAT family N-acetyltransferase [Actinokineospora alba]|nr:GNAT family N-acetyltransferase [Actinokineospora alba]